MRAGLLIVAVVLAGLALVWALSTPPYLPSTPEPAPAESDRPQPGRVTLAPARTPAPSPSIETKPAGTSGADTKPVDVKPVDAKSIDVKPVVVPADAKPAEPQSTDTQSTSAQPTDTQAVADVPKGEPDATEPDDSATSGTDDADSTVAATGDETEGTNDEPSASEPSIDPGRAADLLADWMAREDVTSGEDGQRPPGVEALAAFDQEEADPEWSEPTAQQIEATLRAWLDALPENIRAHMALIHVECRETLCQILAADADSASQAERAQASQEWQQALGTLPQQPWWASFGFVDLRTSVNTDQASGYVLYQTYLRREVKPAG